MKKPKPTKVDQLAGDFALRMIRYNAHRLTGMHLTKAESKELKRRLAAEVKRVMKCIDICAAGSQ